MDDWRERVRLAVKLSDKKHAVIAWEAGITPTTLSRVLNDKKSHPGFEVVVRIVHATGEHVGWILREPRAPLSAEDTERMREIAAFLRERFPAK